MREARKKLAEEWANKPRKEEIDALRRKYGNLTGKNRAGG